MKWTAFLTFTKGVTRTDNAFPIKICSISCQSGLIIVWLTVNTMSNLSLLGHALLLWPIFSSLQNNRLVHHSHSMSQSLWSKRRPHLHSPAYTLHSSLAHISRSHPLISLAWIYCLLIKQNIINLFSWDFQSLIIDSIYYVRFARKTHGV